MSIHPVDARLGEWVKQLELHPAPSPSPATHIDAAHAIKQSASNNQTAERWPWGNGEAIEHANHSVVTASPYEHMAPHRSPALCAAAAAAAGATAASKATAAASPSPPPSIPPSVAPLCCSSSASASALRSHLATVRSLQAALNQFKHQVRHMIDAWTGKRNGDEQKTESEGQHQADGQADKLPSTSSRSSPPSIADLLDIQRRVEGVRDAHVTIYKKIMHEQVTIDGVNIPNKTLFDIVDRTLYTGGDGLSSAASSASPHRRHGHGLSVNYECMGGMERGNVMRAIHTWDEPTLDATYQQHQRDAIKQKQEQEEKKMDQAMNEDATMQTDSTTEKAATSRRCPSDSLLSSLSSSLPSIASTFKHHSSLLLHLIQCSGLNSFDAAQRTIQSQLDIRMDKDKDEGEGMKPGVEVKQEPGDLQSRARACMSDDNPHVKLMELFLLSILRRQVHLQHASVSMSSNVDGSRTTGRPSPGLPHFRLIAQPAAVTSPYAPTQAGTVTHSYPTNPIAGIIVSVPCVLHAYIAFEEEDDEDEDENVGESRNPTVPAHLSSNPPLSSDSPSPFSYFAPSHFSRSFHISSICVVGWNELSLLVDSFARSTFPSIRDIDAQAKIMCRTLNLNPNAMQMDSESALPPFIPRIDGVGKDITWPAEMKKLASIISWLCSYADLFFRPCAACGLHLSLSSPTPLHYLAPTPVHHDATSVHAIPTLHNASSIPSIPTIRIPVLSHASRAGAAHTQYVALHGKCVDRYRHGVGEKAPGSMRQKSTAPAKTML